MPQNRDRGTLTITATIRKRVGAALWKLKPKEWVEEVPQAGMEADVTETEKLRRLLSELYVSGVLWQDRLPVADQQRLLDTVLAASEGRPFELLGLPFPAR